MSTEVVHNEAEQRYEIHVDGTVAGFLTARPENGVVHLPHTEVDERFEGAGLASRLVTEALQDIRRRGEKASPTCPYVKRFFSKHPEYADLLVS